MRFENEVWERYSVSQNRAKRILRRGMGKGVDMMLPILDSVFDKTQVAEEVDLGVVNIPVSQIVGVASERDRDCYASDFLPLPSANSAYAESWTRLYMEHLTTAGLVEPIKCYEYLGKFYVEDGKKRVSVLKDNGATMVKAAVTRIVPVKTDDPEIQCYYEFMETFKKTGLYQIAFTQTGKVDAFLAALGYDPDHVWNDSDRYSFMFHWYPFERALELAFEGNLHITTADAVSVLLRNHSYQELIRMYSWTLAELMQESWKDMYRISDFAFETDDRVA